MTNCPINIRVRYSQSIYILYQLLADFRDFIVHAHLSVFTFRLPLMCSDAHLKLIFKYYYYCKLFFCQKFCVHAIGVGKKYFYRN